MRNLPIDGTTVRVEGAVDIVRDGGGVTPLRLPAAVMPLLPSGLPFAAACTSGVRIALTTDSTTVAVDVEQIDLAPTPDVPSFRTLYDLVVDGGLWETVEQPVGGLYDVHAAEITAAPPPATVVFRDLPPQMKRVEVWLPLRSRVRVTGVRIDESAACEPPAEDHRPRWVVYGSSITHCAEAYSPSRSWPAVAASLTGVHLTSLGLGGNCLLDQWAARAVRDIPADAITLKLGVNVWNFAAMTERVFVAAVHGFLDTVRDGHAETPVLVVSPIYCANGEDEPGPSIVGDDGTYEPMLGTDRPPGALSIGRIRELLEEIVDARRRVGDETLAYLDGRALLGPGDARLIPDGLHPNGAGYLLMGERYARAFAIQPGAAVSSRHSRPMRSA